MPFKSEAQRRYLWANEPEIARDWTDTYGNRIQKNYGGIMQLALAQGGRIGFQGGGRDSGGIADSQGNVGSSFGGHEGGYSPPDDRSSAQQTANTRSAIASAQRANRVADLEKFINRPKYGFTDAAQTNLLSPRSLAATAFGALVGIPGLGFLSNLSNFSVNPISKDPYDSKTGGTGEGIIPILPKTYTDYYANVDQNLYDDDDETVDEVQDFIQRFRVDDPYRQQPGTTDTPITYT